MSTKEWWWGINWLTGKVDKENGNQNFVNLKNVVWVLWCLQKAAITRHWHYKNAVYPMRPTECQTYQWDTILGMLNIASTKILALVASFSWMMTIRKGITVLPTCRSSSQVGHWAARNCQERHSSEQMNATPLQIRETSDIQASAVLACRHTWSRSLKSPI